LIRLGVARNYTHRNLNDSRDLSADFGFAHVGEARFPSDDLRTEETGLSHQRLRPNTRQAFAHRHEEAEEVYVILSGSGRARLDDEVIELVALDAIRVAPWVTRCLESGDDGLEFIVFGPRCPNDAEMVPDWWVD
jgi:mannose-6-phosphate isomerase-like protein (cupin superfamily)